MKKIIFIVLAVLIIVGIAITSTIGLNVDTIYKEHEEISVYIGKETNVKEIKKIAKEIFGNQKTVVSTIELFNDMFVIKTESVSDEQMENLKKKVEEKYGLQDTNNIITKSHVPKLQLRDIIMPYAWPIAISTAIIIVFMAIRYKKLGSIKIILQTLAMIGLAGLLYLSIIAITRYPVNRYIVPTALIIYVLTIIATNIELVKNLEGINKKETES